jgi:hypothetical protein
MTAVVGVAIASGSFKGVFGHGVVTAFESYGLPVAAYGCASSSVVAGSLAAVGQAASAGVDLWLDMQARAVERVGMSEVVLGSIAEHGPIVRAALVDGSAIRLVIATSRVRTTEAAEQTQGPQARSLGRRLLVAAGRGQGDWAAEHLEPECFDSGGTESPLTAGRYDDVAYASTRMLHAWAVPATIAGRPYVDASYTCLCPVNGVFAAGCPTVIAVGTEPGPIATSLFDARPVRESVAHGSTIDEIRPPVDLATLGVDFLRATPEGLRVAYRLGIEAGEKYLAQRGD